MLDVTGEPQSITVAYAGFFNRRGSVTSHRDDVSTLQLQCR